MAEIKLNYDVLSQQAGNLEKLKTDYTTLEAKTQTMIREMQEKWAGDSCQAFAIKMGEYMKEIAKIIAILERFRTYTNSTTTDFKMVDQECANLIRNSF